MAPYTRVLVVDCADGPGGTETARARLDDPFHGFEVTLSVRGDSVIGAEATSHRHPWTTCPGALPSARSTLGSIDEAADRLYSSPRADTCVHVNDLVALASRRHEHRRYDVEVTPHGASLTRDAEPHLGWRLDDWVITSPGPYAGLHFADRGWRDRLAVASVDDDTREALRVMRRAIAVAMGYYELDWSSFEMATDIDWSVMAESCHTFSGAQVTLARRLAVPPDTSLFS